MFYRSRARRGVGRKFTDNLQGGIGIEVIVVAELFAVEAVYVAGLFTVNCCLLMWIFLRSAAIVPMGVRC